MRPTSYDAGLVTPVRLLLRTTETLSRAIVSRSATLRKDVAEAAMVLLPCLSRTTACDIAEQVLPPSRGTARRFYVAQLAIMKSSSPLQMSAAFRARQ